MSKTQLLAHLADKSGIAKKQMVALWDVLVQTVYKEAKDNGVCVLPGLGKLVKQQRKARLGRNPATGEQIQIPAKTVCKFRVSKAAKDSVL